MSTSCTTLTYPFDPTGSLVSNLIQGEQQQLVAQNFRNQHFIVPKAAPFFADTLSITYQDTQGHISTLEEGVDYYVTHWFISASRACAMRVYGSISFINTALAGIVSLNYQTVGGEWTVSAQQIATIMADVVDNPRITSWEEVSGTPYAFPPEAHSWDVNDMVGMSCVVTAIGAVTTALQSSGSTGLAAHIANHNNPHVTTAAQVGLGNVQNYGMAQNSDAVAGTSTTLYMSPATTAAAIQTLSLAPLTAHITNYNNPHQTSATQVGLGLVQNYGVAQNTDAAAGTSTTLYMTPATTMVAINSSVGSALQAHILNYNNPHETSAVQVGLGNVANFSVAQNSDAIAGTANNLYMTPAATAAAIANQGSNAILQAHITNYSNPHQTTAAQVGAYTTLQVNNLLTGYVTTCGTAANATEFDGFTLAQVTAQILSGTANNASNFGGLTPAQWQAALQGGTASDSEMFGGMTPAQWDQYIANATVANATELNGLTVCQLQAQILTGTAANANEVYGLTQAQLQTAILAGTAANASELGGLTVAQLTSQIQAGTASNASSVYGLSQAALTGAITTAVNNQLWTTDLVVAQDNIPAAADTSDPLLWTPIAQMFLPGTSGLTTYPDLQLIVTGGDSTSNTDSGTWFVRMSARDTGNTHNVGLQVISLTGIMVGGSVQFGWTIDTTTFANAPFATIWIQTAGGANPISVNALSGYNDNFLSAIAVQNTAPSGIQYATADTFATISEMNNMVGQLTTAFQAVVAAVQSAAGTSFNAQSAPAQLTLSNGNLTLTGTATGWFDDVANIGLAAGKGYFEVTANTLAHGVAIGIANSTEPLTAELGSDTNGIAIVNNITGGTKGIYYNGAYVATSASGFAQGSTVGVAVDMGAKKIWFYNPTTAKWNEDILTNQNPATGTGGISIATIMTSGSNTIDVYPAAGVDANGEQLTLNGGASSFVNTLPSGFSSWNSLA